MKYELLLADADGTLFDFHAAESQALKNTFFHFQVADTQEHRALYQMINTNLWTQYEKGLITQKEIENQRFEDWYKEIYGVSGKGMEIEEYYIQQLGKGTQLLFGAQAFVEKISEYMPIEIVTNGITCVQVNRLQSSAIAKNIQGLWISEEIGMAKPHPKMIHLAIEKYSIDKKKVIFLGDSLQADIGAANNAGIDSIWITREKRRNKAATYQVSSLSEVEKILLKE
ncbi:MAG: noncanonical pyrimidine nucleotidase, YjjG family [Clostridiales bacterium]|nr:noncanonical pyrimidine nucleotidase, YjjG family [Clostridiales bacterium]